MIYYLFIIINNIKYYIKQIYDDIKRPFVMNIHFFKNEYSKFKDIK